MNKKKELPGFWPDDFAYREFFEYLSRTPPLYITKIVCIMTRTLTVYPELLRSIPNPYGPSGTLRAVPKF